MSSRIPIIDVSPWTTQSSSDEQRSQVVNEMAAACRAIGFFGIVGHGVDPAIVETALTAAHDFFDLPVATKLQSKTVDEASYPYGYENSEVLARGKQTEQPRSDTQQQTTATRTAATPAIFHRGE